MRMLLAAGAVFLLCLLPGGEPVLAQAGSSQPAGLDGQAISDLAMTAWATGTQADIDAIYDSDVEFRIDGRDIALDRDELTERIADSISAGDALRQVGPVSEYRPLDGTMIVGTLLEVIGATRGGVVLCYYRVSDDLITHHRCRSVEESQDASPQPVGAGTDRLDGQSISDLVMSAWASGTQADVEAVYSPDVVWEVDLSRAADGVRELTELINLRIEDGDVLHQVGPVSEYQLPDGALIVGTMLEVSNATPRLVTVCYYRVRDDLITRQDCLIAWHP